MTPRELAIVRSVMYASLFDYPLRIDELHRSLVGCAATPQEIFVTFERSHALQRLVEYHDGFFFPAGRRDLVRERRQRERRSRAFLTAHRFVLRLICAIPFTRLVALSGSIAHLNLEPSGDLDLFIVTRGPRVWTVTVAVLLLTKLLRRRRVVCANFIVSDTRLVLDQQDLFTANQVIHLRPLIGRALVDELCRANPFITELYPNARQRLAPVDEWPAVAWRSPVLDRIKRALEWILQTPSPAIERLCRAAYGWHLRRRATRWPSPEQVRLQADYLKLHTHSHRRSILDRYEEAMAVALAGADRDGVTPVIRAAAR